MGAASGVSGIVDLKEVKGKPSFDKAAFKKEHPKLYQTFVVLKEEGPKGSLTVLTGKSLGKIDPKLVEDMKAAIAQAKSLGKGLIKEPKGTYSADLRRVHSDYVRHLGKLSEAEFELERIKAVLAQSLGTGEAIEGLVKWARSMSSKEDFDTKGFSASHSELYSEFMKPAPVRVDFKVSMCRPYPLN